MKGIVLYADGGVRPTNPGHAGSGIHGYIYDTTIPVKGIGLGSTVATSKGYFPKTETVELGVNPKTKGKKEENTPATESDEADAIAKCLKHNAIVMPVQYVDMALPIDFTATNNLAELNALIRAMEYVLHCKKMHPELKYAIFNSDSDLTVKGATEWLEGWKKRDYMKGDGTPVANHQWWRVLSDLVDKLQAEGVTWFAQWVRGHAGEYGNEKSDMMATLAVYKAYNRRFDPTITTSPVEGYWKMESELHPFIQHKCLYYNTGPGYHQPGVYHMGNHGKDDDLLGNRQSDGSYSHVRLNQPEQILEEVVKFSKGRCNESDNLWVGYITRLAMPATRESLTVNGGDSFDPMSDPHVGYRGIGSGKDLLLRMLRPPHLANRAVTEVNGLARVLDRFIQGNDPDQVALDITDKIYDIQDVTDKKGVTTRKLTIKATLPVGMPSIVLPVSYKVMGSQEVQSRELTFTCGIDILTRNALKRLENLNPCVYVVTWSESSESFRYATIVKTDDGIGIWGGVYSNLFLIPKKTKQKAE